MNKKAAITTITALTAALMLVSSVAASGLSERVDAYVNKEIKVEMDGNVLVMQNADGSMIYPVIYNDRTYLPMRAIAQALGIQVNWDLDTMTVTLTEEANTTVVPGAQESTTASEPQPTPLTEQSSTISTAKINQETARLSYAIKIPDKLNNIQVETWGKGRMSDEIKQGNVPSQILSASHIQYIGSDSVPVNLVSIIVYYENDWELLKDTDGIGKKLGSLDTKIYVVVTATNPYTQGSADYKEFQTLEKELNTNRYYVTIGNLN